MTKEDKKVEEETQKAIARAAAGGVAAQVLMGHVPPTVAVLATAAGTVLLPEFVRATIDRAQRRVGYFLGECRAYYGRQPGRPRDATEAEVDPEAEVLEALNAPETRDATLEALRAALDAVADDAIPCIARLMHSYTSRAERPNRIYRGMLRMLAECDAQDLRDLRRAVAPLLREPGGYGHAQVATASHDDLHVHLRVLNRPKAAAADVGAEVSVQSGARVINLLTAHGVARQAPVIEGIACVLPRDMVAELARVLGEEPQATPAGDT